MNISKSPPSILTLLALFLTAFCFYYYYNQSDVSIKGHSVCECVRPISSIGSVAESSTCSEFATLRGKGQKVVSYSFYVNEENPDNNERRYFSRIEFRAQEVLESYPGWTMRLYYDVDNEATKKRLCDLYCRFPHLDLCNVNNLPQPLGNLKSKEPIGKLAKYFN